MPKLHFSKRHEKEISSLRDAYDGRLKELQAVMAELKDENRRLAAEVSLFRAQKQAVSDAMIAASEKREEMRSEFDSFVASQRAIVLQAAEKAQTLLEEILEEYPDREKTARFKVFRERLDKILGEEENTAEGLSEPAFSESLPEEIAQTENRSSDFSPFPPSETEKTSADGDGKWKLEEVLQVLGLI